MSNKAPNQRAITIQKEQSDKKHLYAIINLAAMDAAARTLTSLAGIKLWMYLDKNQDNYKIEAFSAQGFCEWANVSRAAYNTAFEELREKGYMILNEGTKTVFTFYEKPQEESANNNLPHEEKRNVIRGNTILPITDKEQIIKTDKEYAPELAATRLTPPQNHPEVKEVKEITLEEAKYRWDGFTIDERGYIVFSVDSINVKLNGKFRVRQ